MKRPLATTPRARKKTAELIRELRATPTKHLTPAEKRRAILANARSFAQVMEALETNADD